MRLWAQTRRFLSASLAERAGAFARDVAALWSRSPGRGPRVTARRRTVGRGAVVLRLEVAEVVREASDAVTLVFRDERALRAASLGEAFCDAAHEATAGQFLTLEVNVGGRVHKRAYSLSGAPGRAPQVTVKRVAGGIVSNHLVDHARVGDVLRAHGPSGSFVLPEGARRVLFVAGGVGITPLVAQLEALLEGAPDAKATLLYGSRAMADTIFRARLEARAADPRLTLRFVFEDGDAPGRLDAARLRSELSDLAGGAAAVAGAWDAVMVCGPRPMMDAVAEVAAALGLVTPREERFESLGEKKAKVSAPQDVTVLRGAARDAFRVRPGQTLLEAAQAAGVAMPYSCTMGGCGACRVRLVAGEVVHDEPNGMSEAERRAGYTFACVSRPLTPCTVEVPA